MTAPVTLAYTSPLLEAIRSGVRVVVPVNGSVAAQLAIPAIKRLLLDLGARPPLLAFSQSGPNSREPDLQERDGFEAYPVPAYGMDLAAYVRQRWEQQIKAVADLRQLEVQSPWPSYIRPGCVPALQISPLVRSLSRDFRGRPVILVNWSAQQAAIPESLPTAGIIQWSPLQPGEPALLSPPAERGQLGTACLVCRLCPLANAGHTQSVAISPWDPALEQLLELEASTTFPFRSQQWLSELQSRALTGEQALRHRSALERAARREAASYLLPPDRLLLDDGKTMRAPTPQECGDIAIQRQMLSEALGVSLPHTTPAAVAATFRHLLETAPPMPLADFLKGRASSQGNHSSQEAQP